jgi:hypothetical protein
MPDQHSGFVEGLTSPADNAAAVTPSDSTDLAYTSRALYVGGAGNIVATMAGGGDVTFKNLTAGTVLPVRVTRVKSTNTTATDIVNLY